MRKDLIEKNKKIINNLNELLKQKDVFKENTRKGVTDKMMFHLLTQCLENQMTIIELLSERK